MAWSKTGLTALLAAALVSVATCQDPAISVSPEDTTLLEGTSAVLDCTVTNPQHADITMVKWYRATKSFNSEQIGPGTSYPRYSHVDADYATSGNYALLIDSLVLDEDNFNWKCAIVVAGTTDEIISEEAFLTVAVMPLDMHFYYNTELYNDGGEIQSNISMPFELECKTTDTNPEPSFKWSKRNRATDEITEITEGVSDPLGEAGSKPNLYTFTSHLKIDSLDRSEDDHDFICAMDLGLDDAIDMENDTDTDASNGTKSISIKLGVYGLGPSFEGVIMNTELTFDAGASVTIVCNASANPEPDYEWLKSDRKSSVTKSRELKFDKISGTDSGKYVCKAVNAFGEEYSSDVNIQVGETTQAGMIAGIVIAVVVVVAFICGVVAFMFVKEKGCFEKEPAPKPKPVATSSTRADVESQQRKSMSDEDE